MTAGSVTDTAHSSISSITPTKGFRSPLCDSHRQTVSTKSERALLDVRSCRSCSDFLYWIKAARYAGRAARRPGAAASFLSAAPLRAGPAARAAHCRRGRDQPRQLPDGQSGLAASRRALPGTAPRRTGKSGAARRGYACSRAWSRPLPHRGGARSQSGESSGRQEHALAVGGASSRVLTLLNHFSQRGCCGRSAGGSGRTGMTAAPIPSASGFCGIPAGLPRCLPGHGVVRSGMWLSAESD